MPALEHHSTASRKYKGPRHVHQNRVKFNPNRHLPECAILPHHIVTIATSLCCRRCQDIIRWKLDYGKYPTLIQIKKHLNVCLICQRKSVSIPFHSVCQDCSAELRVCAKCKKTPEESAALAQDAIRLKEISSDEEEYATATRRRDSGNENDDEADDAAAAAAAAGDYAEKEKEEQKPDEDNTKEKAPSKKQQQQQDDDEGEEEEEEDNNNDEEEEEEEEFPELIRLRGLDVSALRVKLHDERHAAAVAQINSQGKLRERERRTAMRKMKRGDAQGALGAVSRLSATLDVVDGADAQNQMSEEVTKDTEVVISVAPSTTEAKTGGSRPTGKSNEKTAVQSKPRDRAGETSSDEETL